MILKGGGGEECWLIKVVRYTYTHPSLSLTPTHPPTLPPTYLVHAPLVQQQLQQGRHGDEGGVGGGEAAQERDGGRVGPVAANVHLHLVLVWFIIF